MRSQTLPRLTALCLACLQLVGLQSLLGADSSSLELQAKPDDPFFAKFNPVKAPVSTGLLLRAGDRLAICGDSITEQKMYSRIMETYLTVCVPELGIRVRQYGWSGETAPGFLGRMTNDCLSFKPTIATTCYGMNDHGYRTYEASIGQRYGEAMTAIVKAFKNAGARVVLGSAGCVGPKVPWSKAESQDMNLNLCELRNLDIQIASQEHVGFADVFWPMLTAGQAARQRISPDYALAGKDSVHPDWAGHLVMAYAFLKAFGLDGDLGTFTVDLQAQKATASAGHKVTGFTNGELQLSSKRYPFCAQGPADKDNSLRSGMALIPFNQDLNRLILVVKNGSAQNYKITWGSSTMSYSAAQLAQGVNLAQDFAENPFSSAFAKVDNAVAAKQNYETRQIKTLFHGEEGHAEMAATKSLTEKVRKPLEAAIHSAFVPVAHTIRIEPQ